MSILPGEIKKKTFDFPELLPFLKIVTLLFCK